jgi:hypothetical protein
MNIAIVIAHKGGRRIERLTVGESPLRIGRGWGSDILLDDKFVNENHIELSVDDGELYVRDLSTRNGTLLDGKRIDSSPQKVRFGQVLGIGDSQVQIQNVQASVAPARFRSAWFLLMERFGSTKSILSLTAVALFLQALVAWMGSSQEYGLGDALVGVGTLLVAITIAALTLGLVSKLLRNEASLKSHWLVIVIALIANVLIDFLLQIVRFNLQMPVLSDSIAMLAMGAIASLFIVGFLSYATYLSPSKRWLWSVSVVGLFVIFSYSEDWLKEDHQRWTSYSSSEGLTLPPALLFRSTTSVTDYFDASDELFDFTPGELADSDN